MLVKNSAFDQNLQAKALKYRERFVPSPHSHPAQIFTDATERYKTSVHLNLIRTNVKTKHTYIIFALI